MGFHRRYITSNTLIESYKRDKLSGINSCFSADCYVFGDNWSKMIYEEWSKDSPDLEKLIKKKIQ